MKNKKLIEIETHVESGIEKVWECWTNPDHIIKWNFASADWCCPRAQNDLQVGAKFVFHMEARDGSLGFDFAGTYTRIEPYKLIEYQIEDGRMVTVTFGRHHNKTKIKEAFEPEGMNPPELQKAGWQSILDNFKKHVESI